MYLLASFGLETDYCSYVVARLLGLAGLQVVVVECIDHFNRLVEFYDEIVLEVA